MPLTEIADKGYVNLGEYCVGADGATAAAQLAEDFGIKGWRAPELLSANAAHTKPLNTYGGNFGLSRIPLHTDMVNWAIPPRFLMLRCIAGSSSVKTPLIHHRDFLKGVPQATIDRARFRPRRPIDPVPESVPP